MDLLQKMEGMFNPTCRIEIFMQVSMGLMLVYTMLMLWLDVSLYRRYFKSIMWMSIMLAVHSKKRIRIFVQIFMIWFCLIWLMAPSNTSRVVPLFFLIGFTSRLLAIVRPPAILLLASSKSWNFKRITSVLRSRTPYHIIYLLRNLPELSSKNPFDTMVDYEVDQMSNRYIVSDETWKSTVFPLLDKVSVLVIDATYLNEAVAHELIRILEIPELLAKSLLFIPDGPFYMQNLHWRIDITKFTRCENMDEIRKRSSQLIRKTRNQR